jgi:formiminotetrahydrofolate cyclodeaminase
MNIPDLTLAEFNQQLASKAPTPGGGAAAALCGALAAALGQMVCNLSTRRQKTPEDQAAIQTMLKTLGERGAGLLDAIEDDAQAFSALMAAYREKQDTEEFLYDAAAAPLEMMETVSQVVQDLKELVKMCSVNVVSDVGCAAVLARAALESASLNVFANTRLMKDRFLASEYDHQAARILEVYLPKCNTTFMKAKRKLSPES